MSTLIHKALKIGVSVALIFDAYWFIRFTLTKVLVKLWRPKLRSILQESVVYNICSTHDIDFMGHMNNARYFRELDFGRMDNVLRSGIYYAATSLGPSVYIVQHAR